MLNNNKIRVMTKLAMYEQKEGKEDIKISKYYKSDYVRLNVLKTIVGITIGYFLILLMIIAYKSEYIINKAVTLDYKLIGTYILGIYIMLITIYALSIIITYSLKYNASRKRLGKYYQNLKLLRGIYREEAKVRSDIET